MKAEIIAVGTELLMGQVVNTNAAAISECLADLGIDVYYHMSVGDNKQRIKEAILQAEKRSDLLILVGGLGPTEDDVTKQVLAKHLLEKLVYDPQSKKKLEDYFMQTKCEKTANNERQVLVMENAKALFNQVGLAVGAFLQKNNHYYAVLPGPPNEMIPMLTKELKPLLQEILGKSEQIHVRILRFYGIGESQLTTKLEKLIVEQTDPTLAPYAKNTEVTLRLATKSKNTSEAIKRLDKLEQSILAIEDVASYFYGYGDDNSLAKVVVSLLKEKGKMITAAESLTAGLFQSTLGEVEGVSEVYKGGVVAYSLESKAKLLGISEASLLEEGVISEFTARMMAENARDIIDADYALSFTGVAGPDSLEGNSLGTVWIGFARRGKSPIARLFHFSKTRHFVRESAVMRGLDILRRELLKN
ncbi:MAG: competence/damage-inducible protein A [Streptococcaceae bacterium]|jgi:nicotinamide-nucleotide amidase|nr:competence/damage-inducible protein A [Streptococcaceae bacterium]